MNSSSLLIPLLAIVIAGPLPAATLEVDASSSSVAVDVKASPPHEFTCDLQAYEADIRMDPASGEVQSAAFSFRLTDLETYKDKRNEKMRKWMDVDHYNDILWKMESVEMVDGEAVAHGVMTMHGESRPVDVRFSTGLDGRSVTLTGDSDFNYMDFALPKIRLFIFTVNPDLHVHFELKGSFADSN